MAKHKPNQRRLAMLLSVAFFSITLLIGVIASLHILPGQGGQASRPDADAMASISEESGAFSSGDSSSSDESSSSEPSESAPEAQAEPELTAKPAQFHVPDELRAVFISAGADYFTGEDTSKATLASQMDKALNKAKELTMNAVILDAYYDGKALFEGGPEAASPDMDCMDYLITKARELGLYVYVCYDVTPLPQGKAVSVDGDTLTAVAEQLGAFGEKYAPDGILLTGYERPAEGASYEGYLKNGGGMGYENYLRQVPEALVKAAASALRAKASNTQTGLLVEAVWENSATNPAGSETTADYTSLSSGNADTKKFVEEGLCDFVMVKNFDSTVTTEKAPFRTVATWWSQVASGAGVRLYTLHANEKLGQVAGGWSVMEQLTKQLIDQEKIGGYSGSVFHSLAALASDPGGTTATLVQYMNNEINEQWVLTQLALTTPAQLTYTTKEQTVTFQGASDPQAEVTINGEKVPTNESGYFAIKEDLKVGLNTFSFVHKGKTLTYNITRQVQVLKEVSPTGKLSVDGGMEVTVTAMAYEDAVVTASVGGQQITLTMTDDGSDTIDRDSGYKQFIGVFTAPSASASATPLGNITFTGTAQGETQAMEGAMVVVNKKAVMGDGAVVYVSAEQAETFPINTLNDNSHSGYYPLPQGTVDKTYGDEIVYKNGSVTKTYWKLESGVRVYTSDIKASGGNLPDNNAITGMTMKSSGAYTTLSLATEQKIPYTVAYDGNSITFKFSYTARVPESASFKNNALFQSGEWSGSNLTLSLKKAGGFLGYKATYEGGNLVLRFNNSPGSLSGARIVVDPGHGGNDIGAKGFYPGKHEADINLAVAQKLVSELKSRGASVLMCTPGSTMASRLAMARAFNPQVLVSVHCNSSPTNSKAKGAEVYYFYPFQKQLAATVSANIAASLNSDNRGAKSGLYYMTRESQFACVLMEMGFVSNESEYTKLINSKYQNRIAEGIANGISGYLGGTNSGGGTGSTDDDEGADSEAAAEKSSGSVESIKLEADDTSIEAGDQVWVYADVTPGDADDTAVKWSVSDSDLAEIVEENEDSCLIEGLDTGRVTVTAKAADGSGVKASVKIKIS